MSNYETIQRASLLCDAENAILRYFEKDASMQDLSCPEFEDATGFTLEEALNPNSPKYLLEVVADEYQERMDFYGGEMSSSAAWELAVEKFLN